MISLEQIRSLEQKVNLLVEELSRVRDENAKLKTAVKSAQTKTADLESMVSTYKQEQEAIEKGILSVLSKLDKLEDEVSLSGPAPGKEGPKVFAKTAAAAGESRTAVKDLKKTAAAVKGKTEEPGAGAQDELDIF